MRIIMNTLPINHGRAIGVLFLFFITHFTSSPGCQAAEEEPSIRLQAGAGRFQPITEGPIDYRVAVELAAASGGRRRLTPFQLCVPCKCCANAADPSSCATMPCCFGIDCQLPNKPFGVCAFVPKACNCDSCKT
ncbi:uncharacterized protein LOC127788847 [Diospyros lotus]|uniref:uncharacterized protein LOC127788847 n=1 Tax=Diospyros lotus TaxID=55363 RepID=UPI0022525706|nr:uncharacterized protein LOC127788847 [Diospyros lotus]